MTATARVRQATDRVGPWTIPLVVAVEVVAVLTGALSLGRAALVLAGVETVLATLVAGRLMVTLRRFRGETDAGCERWVAAEHALALLLPHRVARLVVLEVRLLVCVTRWLLRRHPGRQPDAVTYHHGLRAPLGIAAALVVVEGAVIEIVLAVALTGTAWPWIALGVHAYGLLWLGGLAASFATRPHVITGDTLLVRDGILSEVPSHSPRS